MYSRYSCGTKIFSQKLQKIGSWRKSSFGSHFAKFVHECKIYGLNKRMFSPPSLTVESNLKVSAWNADKIPPLSLCTLREKIEREMIHIYIYIYFTSIEYITCLREFMSYSLLKEELYFNTLYTTRMFLPSKFMCCVLYFCTFLYILYYIYLLVYKNFV